MHTARDIKLFTCNSNPALANAIANALGIPLGASNVTTFSDGEISVSLGESVRGSDVYLVQSTCAPVNDHLMELLLMCDAAKRASAGRITAVIPYFGYARQDRKAKARDPISAKLVANLICRAGADRVLTMDLHAPQIQGFFDIPLDHLQGVPVLRPYFMKKYENSFDDVVIVSPDFGSVTRARKFAGTLELPIAIIDKRRPRPNECEVMNIIGDVRGKRVIIVDDMIDTAGTLCNAAKAVMERGGAKEVSACATHGVLSGPALQRLEESVLTDVVVLDTIPQQENQKKLKKLTVLPVAEVFGEAIRRIYEEKPVSPLFE